jgi:hypothetical protein
MKNFSAHDAIGYENKGDDGKANLKRPMICLSRELRERHGT